MNGMTLQRIQKRGCSTLKMLRPFSLCIRSACSGSSGRWPGNPAPVDRPQSEVPTEKPMADVEPMADPAATRAGIHGLPKTDRHVRTDLWFGNAAAAFARTSTPSLSFFLAKRGARDGRFLFLDCFGRKIAHVSLIPSPMDPWRQWHAIDAASHRTRSPPLRPSPDTHPSPFPRGRIQWTGRCSFWTNPTSF